MSIIVSDSDNLKAALAYAALGWKVYPVWGVKDGKCLCGGISGCRAGKHPYGRAAPHGEKDATADETTLRQWFKGSAVNVGVSIHDYCVIDFDPKSGGMETLAKWQEQYGEMPLTPTIKSGSGGRHYLFRIVDRPTNGRIAQGVDYLASGGRIAPPSLHVCGNRYEWLTPVDTPIAETPAWLKTIVLSNGESDLEPTIQGDDEEAFDPMRGIVESGETFEELGDLPSGGRHDSVKRVVASMFACGYDAAEILAEGLKWSKRQEPRFSEKDLSNLVKYYSKREEKKPQVADLEIGELANGELADGCKVQFANSPNSPFANGSTAETNTTPVEQIGDLYLGFCKPLTSMHSLPYVSRSPR